MKDVKQRDLPVLMEVSRDRQKIDGLLVWVLLYILEQIHSFIDVCTFSFLR